MTDQLMNIDTLAEYLDVPKATIYNWGSRGLGPQRYRVGRHVRFRREEVTAWVQAQAVGDVNVSAGMPLRGRRGGAGTGPGGRAAGERRRPVNRSGGLQSGSSRGR